MKRLSLSAIHLLFTTLLLLTAALELNGQSVQLSVEVDRSISGVESDEVLYFGPEEEWGVSDTYSPVAGDGIAGCIAIRSKENVPVIVKGEMLYADPQSQKNSDAEFQIGVINDGSECRANIGQQTSVSSSAKDTSISFLINRLPRTIRNLRPRDGVVKGYVLVLLTPQKSGQLEDTNKRQLSGQQADAILKIDIEYL